jgi:hypothetical protein
MQPIDEELARLASLLDSLDTPEPSEELVGRTLRLASAQLRAETQSALQRPKRALAVVPVGFKRELARLLGVSAVSLPIVLLWNAVILSLGRQILEAWLPASFTCGLAGFYVFGAIGWLALVLGTLPILAHHQALLRHQEAAT